MAKTRTRRARKSAAKKPAAAPAPVTRKLFGTDGIRGVANHYPMTPEVALQLGRAITHVAQRRARRKRVGVLIGKDTRLSGYMLETALASGICSMGGHVMLCGPIPTPAVAQLTTSMRADAGVVISASHNPYGDNGIKIFGADGFKLEDAMEAEIEELILGDGLAAHAATGARVGDAIRVDDARGRYIVFCKTTFPAEIDLVGVRIVVDAAHGAAYKVAPKVFSELGATVFPLGVKPDGRNINRTGALHPSTLASEVLRRKAHLGVALDGDADRLIVVDEKGRVVDGDSIMALCALRLLRAKKLPKKTLVTTVMSNLGLERAMEAAGGKLVRTKVGDRYVVEAMRKGGYRLGGEQSGHLIFLDHATTGDGIVAALQLLALLVEAERPLSELSDAAVQRVPQVLHSQRFESRRPLEEMTKTCRVMRQIEKKLGRKGRVVVRWSGTEPKLRVMVEGDQLDAIEAHAAAILEAAAAELG